MILTNGAEVCSTDWVRVGRLPSIQCHHPARTRSVWDKSPLYNVTTQHGLGPCWTTALLSVAPTQDGPRPYGASAPQSLCPIQDGPRPCGASALYAMSPPSTDQVRVGRMPSIQCHPPARTRSVWDKGPLCNVTLQHGLGPCGTNALYAMSPSRTD